MKPSETIGRQRRRQWALRVAVVAALAALIVPWNATSATGRIDRSQGSRSVVSSRPLVATDIVTATTTATAAPTTTITVSGAMTATPGAGSTPSLTASPTTPTSGTLSWDTSLTHLPVALVRPAVAVGPDGDMYVFGGGNNGQDYATTYIYNPRGNRWRDGASMPVVREGARAVTLPNGRIAVLGGATPCGGSSNGNICNGGTVYNRVDVYTPSTDSWSLLAPMRSPRYRFAAVLYHGQIYAMGGSDGSKVVASVEAYDPTSNAWRDVASLPRPLEGSAAVVDNGRIDVFGGFPGQANGGPIYDSHDSYDGNTWTAGTPLLQATEDASAALGPDGRVYVIGGFDQGGLAAVQAYNPAATQWSYAASLPEAPCCTTSATLGNGQIYVMGFTDQVAVYGPDVSTADPAGIPGSTMTVVGNDFAPGDTIDLYWGATNDPLLGQTRADVHGQIRVAVTIPATATTGYHTITALDAQAAYLVTTQFVVCDCATPTPASTPTAIPVAPTMAVSPTTTFPTSPSAPSMTTSTPAAVPTAADTVSWDTGTTTLPRPLSRPAAAVGVDGRIYVFGGTANGTESSVTSIYDPAANTWSSGASMPTAREGARAVTLLDGRIVVLGGGSLCGTNLCDHGIVYDRVEVYDPVTNSWATLPHMLTPRYRPAVALLGGRLYAIGGSDGHSVVASAEVLDLSTGGWSTAPSLPHPVQAAASTVDALGHIDVAGGADNTGNVNTLYIFDGASWHSGASLPEPTADMNGTLGPDGNVYVIGGYDQTWVTTVQVYDPRQDSWSLGASLPAPTCCSGAVTAGRRLYALGGAAGTGAPTARVAIGRLSQYPAPTATVGLSWDTSRTSLPQGRSRAAVAVGRDGNIYAFGGLAFSHPNGVYTGDETATTDIYHPLTNTWTQGAPLPAAREGARAVTLPDGRIAVLGGGMHCVGNSDLCDTGTVTNRVDVYDPGSDAWSSLAPMRSPRYRFAAALYHGRIYAIGGSDGSRVLSSVESYDPATDSWSASASLPQPEEGPVAVTDGTGRIDVVGGLAGSSTTYDTLFLFDGTAWSSGPRLLESIDDAGATLGPDGRVYVIGGFDAGAYRYTARVQVYDPYKATWSEAAPLPVPVSNMGAAMAGGGQLYAIGAYDGNGVPGVEAQVAIYGPSIGVDSLSALPGATVTVSGTGFTPHGTVSLSLDSSGAIGLIEGTADVSGTISLLVTIPLTTTSGPHTVTALDVSASYPVTTSIVVRTGATMTTPTGTVFPSGGAVPGSATPSSGLPTEVATENAVRISTATTTAPASTASPIPTPTATATATPVNTPVPPAVTSVPRAPTDTPAPTNTAAPSDTPTPTRLTATPTSTPLPPTNIPATVTEAPTNAPPSIGAPHPSSTPTTIVDSTSSGSGTHSRTLPATSVPPPVPPPTRPSPARGGGVVTIVFVDVPHGDVASGGTVGVQLRTTPHALVGITLRLTHTGYALVKHGAHRTRVARTQLLFRSLTHPRADARGQTQEGIRIAYVTAHALSATLTITAQLPSGSATQSQRVTVQPARVHRTQTRPRP